MTTLRNIYYIIYTKARIIPRTFNSLCKVCFWSSLVEGQAKFGETVLQTCCVLCKPCQNFSYLFPPVPTCSHLFIPVHTCSHMFTTVDFSVTICALPVEFSPCEGDIFRSIFLKLHIFAHLIESFRSIACVAVRK